MENTVVIFQSYRDEMCTKTQLAEESGKYAGGCAELIVAAIGKQATMLRAEQLRRLLQ